MRLLTGCGASSAAEVRAAREAGALLLLWALLVAGYGGTWLPVRGLVAIGVLALACRAAIRGGLRGDVPRVAVAGFALWIAVGLIQVAPLPRGAAEALLPWRARWWEAWAVPGAGAVTLSGAPGRTAWALVWLVVWGAWVCAGRTVEPRRLLRGAVWIGAAVGVVVVVQRTGGGALCRAFWPGTRGAHLPLGPFLSKNHAAGLLAALLPLAIWSVVEQGSGAWRHEGPGASRRWQLRFAARVAALGVIAGALVLALSRGGLLAGAGGVVLMAGLMMGGTHRARLRGPKVWIAGALLVPVLAVILALSVPAVERRLSTLGDPEALMRREVKPQLWRDTWAGVRAAPGLGWGLGAFEVVYPAFRTVRYPGDFEHAEQEVLEQLFEGGAAGLVALAALAVGLARAGGRGALAAPWGPAVAGGLGALGLHGMVEFDWHIGAIQALAGLLAGVWWGGGQGRGAAAAARPLSVWGRLAGAGMAMAGGAAALILALALVAAVLGRAGGAGGAALAASLDPWRAERWRRQAAAEPNDGGAALLPTAARRLLVLEPASWRWRLWMAERSAERGDIETMESWLRQADTLAPRHWAAREASGWLRLSTDLERAEADLALAVRGWPGKDRNGLVSLAERYLGSGGAAPRLPVWFPAEALTAELCLDVAEPLAERWPEAAAALLGRGLPGWSVPAPWDRARLARLGMKLERLAVPLEQLAGWRAPAARFENWELLAGGWIRQRLGDEAGARWLATSLDRDGRVRAWRAAWGARGGGAEGEARPAVPGAASPAGLGDPESAGAEVAARAEAQAARGVAQAAFWLAERARVEGSWSDAFGRYQQAGQRLLRAGARSGAAG